MELKDFCDAGALRTLLRGRAIAGASAGTGRGPVLVSASGGQAGGSPWASTPRPYTWEWVAGGKWEHESGSEVILQRGSSGNCGAACCACRPGLGRSPTPMAWGGCVARNSPKAVPAEQALSSFTRPQSRGAPDAPGGWADQPPPPTARRWGRPSSYPASRLRLACTWPSEMLPESGAGKKASINSLHLSSVHINSHSENKGIRLLIISLHRVFVAICRFE